MVASLIGTSCGFSPAFQYPAARLSPHERQVLALKVLSHRQPVIDLAAQRQVSCKFLYQIAAKARTALRQAFDPPEESQEVLFHLPVTKSWIEQFVLAHVLTGHSSFRGVLELLATLLDYHDLSLGSVFNIVDRAVATARNLNAQADRQALPAIAMGAHDEIFQADQPVLVGVDVRSLYCYLLSLEEHRDETTWGVRLLELSDKGLDLQRSIADGGHALRSAQAAVWGDVPCDGDVFHAERELTQVVIYLTNCAYGVMGEAETARRKLAACWKAGEYRALAGRRARAEQLERAAMALSDDLTLLERWLREDVLAVAGEDLPTRRELLAFIIEELKAREEQCPHRIRKVRRMLENSTENLLAFAGVADAALAEAAGRLGMAEYQLRPILRLQRLDERGVAYWRQRARLQQMLGSSYAAAEAAVKQVLAATVRSSSAVENLNGRMRGYFFLRRQIGPQYLELLRFYFNHRCLNRSRRPERSGRSPLQLLSGTEHPHWLELLGYQRFQRA
jgi:hypothetical protein